MDIKKPIFIVGCGRSGTTIFFRTIVKHKDLGYFTNYGARFPRLFKYGIIPFIENNNFTRQIIEKIRPIIPDKETIGIYKYCKIRKKGIPLSGEDLKFEEAHRLNQMISKCLNYHKADRFISKNTNNGFRILYLDEIFPDSIFIHVIRDGRANVNSYLNKEYFYRINFWWWHNKTYDDWIAEGRNPIELAAYNWKNNISQILKQGKSLPKERYYEIKYEDFTEDPEYYFKNTLEFCGLKWNKHFESVIKNTRFENRNYKWKNNLNSNQRKAIEPILHDLLKKFGYI